MESISVVFPVYNQEGYIEQVLRNALDVVKELTDDYEIIVINDGSTDNTRELIDKVAAESPAFRVIHYETPAGLSVRLKEGLGMAGKDIVIYADADLCFDLLDITKAVRAMRYAGADIISAYRFVRARESFSRRFWFSIYNYFIRLVFGLPVRDINFSFKLLKKEVLEHVTLRSNSPFVDTELLVKCYKMGYVIHQIGVDYFYRPEILTPITPDLFWRTLAEVWHLFWDLRKLHPIKR